MTKSLTLEYTTNNSIFDLDGNITLKDLSDDFVQGLLVGHNLIYPDSIKIITDIKVDLSYVTCEQLVDNYTYSIWRQNKRFEQISFLKALCILYNIDITKRYLAIFGVNYEEIRFIQFDSLDFLNGLITYFLWSKVSVYTFHCVFDNDRSYKLNVEWQLPIVHKRLLVRKILSELLLTDLVNIIWEYAVVKCESKYYDAIKCVNETDTGRASWVSYYNSFSNKSEYADNIFECNCCKKNTKPYQCVVTLV
jgi:hypothetical protein